MGTTSVPYIIGPYENIGFTGYLIGSSGIALELLDAYHYSNHSEYLQSSARAEKLIQLLTTNGSIKYGVKVPEYYTGLGMGSTGIAYYNLELYKKFGNSRNTEAAVIIFNHLNELIKEHDKLPVNENNLKLGFSYNLEEGISGLGLTLLYYEDVQPGETNEAYEELYNEAVPNTEIANTENKRIKSFSSMSVMFILIFIKFYYISKKKGFLRRK